MNIRIAEVNGTTCATIESDTIEIKNTQDALDMLANCSYQGADRIIIRKENISPDFFDLKTGLAGDILQKFSNYRKYLAIVGDCSNYTSKSLRDFIYESNATGRILFVSTTDEALERLTKK
jgi:hypothetical protein